MTIKTFTYLVVENIPDVCEGIIRRMHLYQNWQSIGYATNVKQAIEKIQAQEPHLLYLDWGLNGGSAFEVLQSVQQMENYDPYIIFNTGFQKDNPEIPQEIFNKYKVDKYLLKPLWENLRLHLGEYVLEAAEKAMQKRIDKTIWIEDINAINIQIMVKDIVCICQHPQEPRYRLFYFINHSNCIVIAIQWQKCFDLLNEHDIDFFVTKFRSHLVVKQHILLFEKPFVRLKNFPAKIEVVKENITSFKNWLVK